MELKYYTILTSPQYNNPSLLVKDWNKENYPFGFGGVNHDGTECIWAEKQEVYLKKDVDEAIAELKAKLDKAIAERDGNQVCIDALKKYIYRLKEEKAQLNDKLEQEQLLRSHWNEDDYAMVNELERLSNENKKLKQKIESVQASMYCDVVDANMDNRRLRRALWIARAERAEARKNYWYARSCHEGDDFLVSIDGSPVKYIGCIKRTNYDWLLTWSEVESKCRAKAEEYK